MYARLAMSFFCTFERSYSSVLRPILVKLHILTRLIDSFPMVYGSWICIEIEMLIPLGAHAFQQDLPKEKKITALSIFWRKT